MASNEPEHLQTHPLNTTSGSSTLAAWKMLKLFFLFLFPSLQLGLKTDTTQRLHGGKLPFSHGDGQRTAVFHQTYRTTTRAELGLEVQAFNKQTPRDKKKKKTKDIPAAMSPKTKSDQTRPDRSNANPEAGHSRPRFWAREKPAASGIKPKNF